MADVYVAVPPNPPLTPVNRAKWIGKQVVDMAMPLVISPSWHAMYVLKFLMGAALMTGVILSVVLQSNNVKDTIKHEGHMLDRAVELISNTNLTLGVDDTCQLYQGVFILDSNNPPTSIITNNATYVPPSVTMFNLSSLNWEIPKGSLTTTSNFTFYADGEYKLCCDFNATKLEARCTCVWPVNGHGTEFEHCASNLYSLGSEYCQADLLNNQILGVNQLRNPYDEFAPSSNVTALNLQYDQVYIDNILQFGNGTQQAPQSPDEVLVASNHSGGLQSFADVSGCPFSDCSIYPYRFGYEFNVVSLVYPLPSVMNSSQIRTAQDGFHAFPIEGCVGEQPVPNLLQTTCANGTVFPLSPNPYVLTDPAPGQNMSNPQDYYGNDIAVAFLSCGLTEGVPPYGYSSYQAPAFLSAAQLFANNPQYAASPFFPIRTSATYKVEFGCTMINQYLTSDDDEDTYPTGNVNYNVNDPNAKYRWCTHFYDGLADDDSCEAYVSTPSQIVNSNVPCCDMRDTKSCENIYPSEWVGGLNGQILYGGSCPSSSSDYLGCGPCKGYIPDCETGNETTCGCIENANDQGSCATPSEQNYWIVAQKRNITWDAMALQLYTLCIGLDPNNYNTPNKWVGDMFFSIQRVNPMVWATGSSGMTFEMEGHAYWSVNNSKVALYPGWVGQCGIFSAATPWLFNSQQEVVGPTVQMKGVPGFEDVPYPGQAQASNPSMNHMCNTNSAVASNCYIRVNSFLPGKPQVVSSTSKRDAKVWEPDTGKMYWKGRIKDMPKAKVWETEFKEPEKRKRMQNNMYQMLKRAEEKEKERKREEMQRQHAANIKSIVEAARHPRRKKTKTS